MYDKKHQAQDQFEACRFLEGAVGFQSLRALRVAERPRHVESTLVDEDDGRLVEPLHALAVLPEAVLDALFLLVDVGTKAVLLALVPPPFIPTTVRPEIDTVAFLFIV